MFQNTPINLVITIYCMKLYSRPQSIRLNYAVVHNQSYETIQLSTNNHMKLYSRPQPIIWSYKVVHKQSYVYFFELLFRYFLFSISFYECWNTHTAFIKQHLVILAKKLQSSRRINLIHTCGYRGENNSRNAIKRY